MPVSATESTFVPVTSRQAQSRQGPNPTTLSEFIIPLLQWSRDSLPLPDAALLLEVSASSVIQWIREERKNARWFSPSSYEDMLIWAQTLVERLDTAEKVVSPGAADIRLATSLAYGYFAKLLELGEKNTTPLGLIFGFVHDISIPFESILRATSLENSEEIVGQLALALVDLVALISSLSIQLFKAIQGLGSGFFLPSDVHKQYASQIEIFRNRCESVRMAILRHRLQGATQGPVKALTGDNLDAIRSWLAPADPAMAGLNENVPSPALNRAELTCSWVFPYVMVWRMDQSTQIHLIGRSGLGKTVLTHVILGDLQYRPAANIATPLTIYVSISTRVPAEGTMCSIARGLLNQLFTQSIGHVPLLLLLSESFEQSRRTADRNAYDNLLWNTLKRALEFLAADNQVFLVVDGVDEALSDESTLLRKLISIIPETTDVKLITVGTQRPLTASSQTILEVTENLVSDNISSVVEASLDRGEIFSKLPEKDKEAFIGNLTAASEGSFLWAKLACRYIRSHESPDQLGEAIDFLRTTKPSVSDFIHLCLNKEDVSVDTKHMLVMLTVAQRPLRVAELQTLAAIVIDQQIIASSMTQETNPVLRRLHPVGHLLSWSRDAVSFEHALIKDAVLNLLPPSQLNCNEDPAIEFLTRLFICLKRSIGESSEPTLTPLDEQTATSLQHGQALLPYALRYWPVHYQNLSAAPEGPPTRLAERFAPYLPTSTTCIRLQSTLWAGLPLPECLCYHELTTDLYRTALGHSHVATLQSMILLAGLYDGLEHVDQASRMYYDAAMSSRTSLTARHPLTLQLASRFLELTSGQEITSSHTELMHWRGELLALSVECHELQHGETSDEAGAARRILAEHQSQRLGE